MGWFSDRQRQIELSHLTVTQTTDGMTIHVPGIEVLQCKFHPTTCTCILYKNKGLISIDDIKIILFFVHFFFYYCPTFYPITIHESFDPFHIQTNYSCQYL